MIINNDRRALRRSVVQFVMTARGSAIEPHVGQISDGMDRVRDALGISVDDMTMIMLYFAYIMRAGRLNTETLESLEEKLPGAMQVGATALGVQPDALRQQAAAGEVTAERFLPAFVEAYAAEHAQGEDDLETIPGMTLEDFQAWSDGIIREVRDAD